MGHILRSFDMDQPNILGWFLGRKQRDIDLNILWLMARCERWVPQQLNHQWSWEDCIKHYENVINPVESTTSWYFVSWCHAEVCAPGVALRIWARLGKRWNSFLCNLTVFTGFTLSLSSCVWCALDVSRCAFELLNSTGYGMRLRKVTFFYPSRWTEHWWAHLSLLDILSKEV